MRSSFQIIAILFFVSGCAVVPPNTSVVNSVDELPTIQEVMTDKLSKLKIGMQFDDFAKILPEAHVAGQNGGTDAYEISIIQKYMTQKDKDYYTFYQGFSTPQARTNKQVLWFYFYKGILVSWGRPQDWPTKPDLIIEQRNN